MVRSADLGPGHFVFELTESAVQALSQVETPAHLHGEPRGEPIAAPRLRSLFECQGEVPECRRARSKRYPLNNVLTSAPSRPALRAIAG